MLKLKEVSFYPTQTAYKWGAGMNADITRKCETNFLKVFKEKGWKLKDAAKYERDNEMGDYIGISLSPTIVNPNLPKDCQLYLHPMEIVGILPEEEIPSIKETLKKASLKDIFIFDDNSRIEQ